MATQPERTFVLLASWVVSKFRAFSLPCDQCQIKLHLSQILELSFFRRNFLSISLSREKSSQAIVFYHFVSCMREERTSSSFRLTELLYPRLCHVGNEGWISWAGGQAADPFTDFSLRLIFAARGPHF